MKTSLVLVLVQICDLLAYRLDDTSGRVIDNLKKEAETSKEQLEIPSSSSQSENDDAIEQILKRNYFFILENGPVNSQNIHNQREDVYQEHKQEEEDASPFDSWSIVWYIASFGGLIAFFLVVSCSEWCCRRQARRACQRNSQQINAVPDTPPPSYEQFAPPSYESICFGRGEKSEFDVYVVPVHAINSIIETDEPPSYSSAQNQSGLSQLQVDSLTS